jgi:hypothetical protein
VLVDTQAAWHEQIGFNKIARAAICLDAVVELDLEVVAVVDPNASFDEVFFEQLLLGMTIEKQLDFSFAIGWTRCRPCYRRVTPL